MQRRFSSLITAAIICAATIGLASVAKAADPTGTWKYSQPGRQGGDPIEITLKLKYADGKLTGSVTRPARGGGAPTETEIKDGKVKDDEISFTTSVERGGNTFTTKYNGKLSGDTIKGKIEAPGRDGNTQSRDWEAKREKK